MTADKLVNILPHIKLSSLEQRQIEQLFQSLVVWESRYESRVLVTTHLMYKNSCKSYITISTISIISSQVLRYTYTITRAGNQSINYQVIDKRIKMNWCQHKYSFWYLHQCLSITIAISTAIYNVLFITLQL